MIRKLPRFLPGLLLAAWIAVGWSGFERQYRMTAGIRARLADRSANERALAFDAPGLTAVRRIAEAVEPSACVLVLAHAGPAALDYYRARFAYELYPRRVRLAADSAAESADGDCRYLAVFRDSEANLAAEPFAGAWDSAQLEARLDGLEPVSRGDFARIYRRR